MESDKYNYVVTALKPSRIDHLCVGKFTDSKHTNMITMKSNRLEIFKIIDEVLEPMLDIDIHGDVVLLDLIRLSESDAESRDLLVIATRKFCAVYEWHSEAPNLFIRSFRTIPEPDLSDYPDSSVELLPNPIGIIDQEWRLIGLYLWVSQFEVIPFNTEGQLGTPYFIRLCLIRLSDIKFLFGLAKPTILALEEGSTGNYLTYEVSLEDQDFHTDHCDDHLFGEWPNLIIPLPAPVYGVLLLGLYSISYHTDSIDEYTKLEYLNIRAYDKISDWKYLLLNEDGSLHLLTIDVNNGRYNGIKTRILGPSFVPGASKVSVLGPRLVYVCSGHGDSQLLKMRFQLHQRGKRTKFPRGAEGSCVKAVERYVNIGPIRDFCVVDLERLGQGTVVTLSGSITEGSLRIIRYGFKMNNLASVKEEGITGLWSLRPGANDTFIVVSYSSGTRLLAINNEDVLKDTKIEGLSCEHETLFCHYAIYDQLVQVTSNFVRLVSLTAKNLEDMISFSSDNRITVATANMSQVLCAGVRSLVYLQICNGTLNVRKHANCDYDVSCLDMNPVGKNPASSELAAVGFWNDRSVGILSLPDLKLLSKEHFEGDAVVRSVLLCAFEGISYLMCGLGDGNLVIFLLNLETCELTDRKKVSLGSSPLSLCTFTSKNTTHIFAASDSPTVIYSINKKLLYSQLDLKEVNFVCPLNSAAFPDSFVVADTDGITISMIEYQMPHIRTILLEESIHCICSQLYSRTLAMCSVKYRRQYYEYYDGTGIFREEIGSINLLSDRTFEVLSRYSLKKFETGVSIVSCSLLDDDTVYYFVGTSSCSPWSSTDLEIKKKGRILVFVVKDRQLELVAQKKTYGSVESLICFNGKLLASVQKKIHLYKWIRHDDGPPVLELECQTNESYRFPLVATRGNLIVVGSDVEMRVSVLMYKPDSGSIKEIASHDARWATAVEILDDGNTYLFADKNCNLVTIKKDNDRVTTESDNQPLSYPPVGSYHVGYCVNQFKRGSLVIQVPEFSLGGISTCLFGTANGAIGLIASLPHEQYLFLEGLQSSLRRFVRVVGDPKEWRSDIHDEHGTYYGASLAEVRGEKFLDGDLIESFLRLNVSGKRTVSDEINVPVEDLIKRVEELTRLRWGC